MNEPKLKAELSQLNAIREQLLEALFDENRITDGYNELVQEYRQHRAELLLELSQNYQTSVILDPELRKELKRFIKEGDELLARLKNSEDTNIKNLAQIIGDQLKPEFSSEREDELIHELFYSWFSPVNYLYRLIETGVIVIKNLDFPEKLQSLIYELRHCIIFENYLAAGIMLRTIADVAVKDVLRKNFPQNDFKTLGEKLDFLETKSGFAIPASVLNAYRKDLNDYVHGKKLPNSKFIKQYMEIILDQVQELYEKSE